MRAGVNALIVAYAAAAILLIEVSLPRAAAGESHESELLQQGEDRWVPSFAITSGITSMGQSGEHRSVSFPTADPSSRSVLRVPEETEDRVVSPYVGGVLELMTPALPVPTRPRLFVAGEFLPTFGAERKLSQERQPDRIRGPEPGAVLAVDETPTFWTTDRNIEPGQGRALPFGESDANGQGMEQVAQVDTLVYAAKAGVSFPFELGGRQLRLKPAFGWIQYEVEVKGYMVDPTCQPSATCTDTFNSQTGNMTADGFLRESIVQADDKKRFDAFGAVLDVEMDTGRYGPLGTAIYFGGGAYYTPGNREILFSGSNSFSDQIGNDTHVATWRTRVSPWMIRLGIGVRLQWLGSAK